MSNTNIAAGAERSALRAGTPLPAMRTAERADRLRALFDSAGCDALLVTNLANIRYLTGFSGSAALLLIARSGGLFVTDGRYRTQSADELSAAGVDIERLVPETMAGQRSGLADAVNALGEGARLGLEAGSVTWADARRYESEWFAHSSLVATDGLVEQLRLVKDEEERARLAAAAAIADAALAATLPMLHERPTELAFARALERAMFERGAEALSFATIVASGANGALPHHHPGDRRVEPGELVVIDFGAMVDGYHSDMTRTVCVGPPKDATAARMVEVVAEAQAAGVAAVQAGASAGEVDAACRTIISAAGWGEAFVHSTGHGVGLDIHEDPRVGAGSTFELAAGHVVTVEPGVYLEGFAGVRIEDTLFVDESGASVLTHHPKTLVV